MVDPGIPSVEIRAWVCLDAGWLEQVACGMQSREHESLVVIKAKPRDLHAALLLAGFEPGEPGRWNLEGERVVVTPPRGTPLEVIVRYEGESGTVEHSIRRWIRDHHGRQEFPGDPWVFAGSLIAENPDWMGRGEHYVADFSGSIIGLVTFGDEVIGFSRVLSDKQDVQPPEWEAWTERMPPIGTEVTLILRPPGTGSGTAAASSIEPAAGEDAP
ncbi:MAG: YdjY domain-containing protein [Planctomycetota bacterium]